MHRSTPAGTLHRSYDSGGSRTTIESVSDKPMMQEMNGNFLKGESRKDIEAPQNYGFTSVVRDATKGKDGQLEECAEGFVSFLGGNRSFPICSIMDDRRFRLKELEKGDVAMFDYLQHQFHMNDKGMFMTGRTDKTVKIQLAPPPDEQQSSGGGGASARWVKVFDRKGVFQGYAEVEERDSKVSARAAGGGSSQSSGSQKKLKGQKKRYDKTSKHYLEMNKDTHNLVHDQNINYKSGTHQVQPFSGSSARNASGMLMQIFGNKFTGGMGHFMQQVTAAPPASPMHLTTKGYVDSIINGLGFSLPSIPALPMPPLPPGLTWPPDIPMPPGFGPHAMVEYPQAEPDTPRLVLDGGEF